MVGNRKPNKPWRWSFFGSSLLSAYWNGAATYYRGMIRALAARGHEITFFEPDAFERQHHRDLDPPDWAKVVVYKNELSSMQKALRAGASADFIVKCSGVGVLDDELVEALLAEKRATNSIVYWDVDAPATLNELARRPRSLFARAVPLFDFVLTYGGGLPIVQRYQQIGARLCIPIYNALDPTTHFPVAPESRFGSDLTLLANRLPDREKRVDHYFFDAAKRLPDFQFLLGGNGWSDKSLPENIRYLGHVYTKEHNALNCSARAVLNLNRDSMAQNGFSPATRVFEAAGAGACIISDRWEGVEHFLQPGKEIILVTDGNDLANVLRELTWEHAKEIGAAARKRVLAEHTYEKRAQYLEQSISGALC